MKRNRISMAAMGGTLALALTVSGCGGSSGGETSVDATPHSASTAAESSSPVASESAAEEYATVGQYASVVAANQRDITEYTEKVQDCALGWSKGDLPCALAPLTLRMKAGLLSILLSQDAKPENRLLPPPPEIEALVAQTIEAADSFFAASETLCDDYKGCTAEWFNVSRAAGDLQYAIDAWSPYI